MKKILLLSFVLFFAIGINLALGFVNNCTGTTADLGGCQWHKNVTQTQDIFFNSTGFIDIFSDSANWDCNGFQLVGTGKGVGTLFSQLGDSFSNKRVKNCDISDWGTVWYIQQSSTTGSTVNNYLNNSVVDNVVTVMQLFGTDTVFESYYIGNSGIENTIITNSDIGLIANGGFEQDGVRDAVFRNNKMYGGNISVDLGGDSTSRNSLQNEGTLRDWIITGNEFHDMLQAGVWVKLGNGGTPRLATITNNLFDNSDLRLQRSDVTVTGNTFANGSLGHNGCIEPITWGLTTEWLTMNSNDVPICDGNYTLSATTYMWSGSKAYPQTANHVTITSGTATTGFSTVGGVGDAYGRDNVIIQDMNLVNFSNGINIHAVCNYFYPDTTVDTVSNWQVLGMDIKGYNTVTNRFGINLGADDIYGCHITNITMRDNTFTNLSSGIYMTGQFSDLGVNHIIYDKIEISFSDFIDNFNAINESYVFGSTSGSNKLIVFNNFIRSNVSVPHTGFQWFGNVPSGGSFINDQNDCLYPTISYLADRDVTYCSGTYQTPPNWVLVPYNGVNIFCDGTEMVDYGFQTSAGLVIAPYFNQLGVAFAKDEDASNIIIDGCKFTNFSSAIQYSCSAVSGSGQTASGNKIRNNTFNNVAYGIILSNSPTCDVQNAFNWEIYNNIFDNIVNSGFYGSCAISGSDTGYDIYNFNIHNNHFEDEKYGIQLVGCRTGTTCGTNLYNFTINSNTFNRNENHIRFEHPITTCASPTTASPHNVTAHQNIFARDFTAFAVSNTHVKDFDFTSNNWGTGFTGIIDQAIFDHLDNAVFGTINYIPIIGYSLVFGTPFAVQENWEEALSTDTEAVLNLPITYQLTGYDDTKAFNGNEKWLLARSNANARGNVYLSNDAICLNNFCYKSWVDSLDINPQYARVTRFFPQTVNMTTDTIIRFKLYFDSDFWDSGGAMIFRNANDQALIKLDLGITNETNYATATTVNTTCSIEAVTGVPKAGLVANKDTWLSYEFELNDIKNNCPSVYNNIFNIAKNIDRMEFVFGGKKNGVLGDVIWYLDDIEVENVEFNSPPANIPPAGSFINFQETYGSGFNFDVTESDCLVSGDGYSDTQFSSHVPKYTGGDHDWICWLNSSAGSPSVDYEDTANTLHISSELGIQHTVSGANPVLSSWATSDAYDIDMSNGNADHFLFTCDMQNQTNGYSYLLLAENNLTAVDQDFFGYISLKNGGCQYNSSLPYMAGTTFPPCCELMDIAGQDCSSGKTRIDFSEQEIEDNCNLNVGDSSVSHIDRIEFMTLKLTSGADQVFFDDLYLYNTGFIANNSLPSILTMVGIPDPANVSQTVTYSVSSFDPDNNASAIYSAFDCDNNGVLEYAWSIRGFFPVFTCSYPAEGTYTARLWMSDTPHYPTYNVTMTETTDVVLEVTAPHPAQGGSCTGYTPQTCTGSCFFTDNFNYDFMIQCAGWTGDVSDFHPTSNVFGIYGTDIYEGRFELDKGTSGSIKSSQVTSFATEFDIRVKTSDAINFAVFNDEVSKDTLYLNINDFVATAYKDTGSLTLQTMTPNTWYNFRAVVNYNSNTVDWFVNDGFIGSISIYDDGVTSSRKWVFQWADTETEFDLDNFQINILQANENATNVTETHVAYVYNPQMFCAINWTGETGNRFNEQNCVDRGFSVVYPLVSLCIPRACIQDVGLATLSWATSNIFRTIIIVTAFILLAPLLVVLLKRR